MPSVGWEGRQLAPRRLHSVRAVSSLYPGGRVGADGDGERRRDGALMKPRKPKRTAKTTLVDKLLGKKGPVTLTRGEVERLQTAFLDIGQENLQNRRMMSAIAEAATAAQPPSD